MNRHRLCIVLQVGLLLFSIFLAGCLQTEVEVVGADESRRIENLPDGLYHILEFGKSPLFDDELLERKELEKSGLLIQIAWQQERGEYLLSGSGISRAKAMPLGPDTYAVLVSEEGKKRKHELYVLQILGEGLVQLIPDDYPEPDASLSLELHGHRISGDKSDIITYLKAAALHNSGKPGAEYLLAHGNNFSDYNETHVKVSEALLNLDGVWR